MSVEQELHLNIFVSFRCDQFLLLVGLRGRWKERVCLALGPGAVDVFGSESRS